MLVHDTHMHVANREHVQVQGCMGAMQLAPHDLSWLVTHHFREYDKWPWLRVSSLERQLQDHPSFVAGEVLFLILAVFSLLHAVCESRAAEFRRLKLIWVATFIVGTVNDYIFMILPVVDNFWQAQAVLMLTPRMPLYIPCVYNAFMYWPTVAAARVFCHTRRCPMAEAGLAGLLAALFYAPYDMCGARFLWWTWHDTDAGVALRWLGVPGGSTAWTITFTFCFSLLLRLGHDSGWGQLRTLALACWSTPLMIIVLNVFTILGWDRIGMPGPQTVLAASICFSALCIWKPAFKVWPQLSVAHRVSVPEHWSVRFALLGYFCTLILIGLTFSPENQVSTGVHQEFGPCDAMDIDLMGFERKRYICRERFPEEYFRLDCPASWKEEGSRWARVTPEQSMTGGLASWYTICGQKHSDFERWVGSLITLSASGAFLLCWAMSVRDCQASPSGAETFQPVTMAAKEAKTSEEAAQKLRKRQPRAATPPSRSGNVRP
ncbi:unnamed protein product [Symbiodinium natans]|uniref:DUF7802 domain-containing protein n=1 Tax=Symbiodinium natans TaxID=878477 RepID=A0A812RAA2_9DINO|nr:unnamed protein product [Symbiodinium natans]